MKKEKEGCWSANDKAASKISQEKGSSDRVDLAIWRIQTDTEIHLQNKHGINSSSELPVSLLSTDINMEGPGQPSPQQMAAMQQHLAAEAAKRGMTPEQFSNLRKQQLAAEAAKMGMTPEEYINHVKTRAMQQHMQQQHEHGPGCNHDHDHEPRQVPVNPAAPKDPRGIALANFLRSQNLKTRTCILDGNRKELFKGVCSWSEYF
jgi:hypothetical protein